jgi:hypothetical protein
MGMGLYRSPLTLATVEAVFKRHEWRYEIVDEHLITVFDGVPMAFTVDGDREIILLEVPLVPGRGMTGYRAARPEHVANACMYICAVNFQLALGAFSRDHHDGEMRYESSMGVAAAVLTDEQVWQMIEVAHAAVSVRAPTIIALLHGRMTLKQALDEMDQEDVPPAQVV